MRRLTSLIILFALLLSGMVTTAQDDATGTDEVTIAQIVTERANDEDAAEFGTLLAALQAADPLYLDLLSAEDANVTVFAPTNAAFADLLAELELEASDLLADTDLLNEVLAYHVVPGAFPAESIAALEGALIGTALPGATLTPTITDDEAVLVQDATVIDVDLFASNGIVHVIDSVLIPAAPEMADEDDANIAEEEAEAMGDETFTIASLVVDATNNDPAEFTILLDALETADEAVLSALDGAGPYTVFAPTDAAFLAAFDDLGVNSADFLANEELVTTVLLYHVVPGQFDAQALTTLTPPMMDTDADMPESENAMLATLLRGTALEIIPAGDTVEITYAPVVQADLMAANGVIHIIEDVLIPPNVSFE